MPRPRKPWFRKSNKRWYVEFDRKQVNLGPDRNEAFRQFHELMAKPKEERRPRKTAAIALPEIVDHFLEWVHRNRSADTYEWYRYRLERLCMLYPQMAAERLRPYHIEGWISKYELSVTSRRNYLRAAKRCFKWARRQGYLKEDPIADLEVPRAESREVSLSQDEFNRLLTFVRNPELADLMIVTWLTGCRPQESLIVDASHVDIENQRWVFRTSQSKGKKVTRVVYLNDEAMGIVRRLMLKYPEGPLFRNSNDQPWRTDAVNCAFTSIQDRMGKLTLKEEGIEIPDRDIKALIPKLKTTRIRNGRTVEKSDADLRHEAKRKLIRKLVQSLVPHYSLYALRHSFATNALRKGIDSLTVAVLLGHQDPSTLARVYQHLNQNPQHLLEQARKATA
ncbi:MAG: tyrosine-type recombinase/integrase [Planctomycetaceae bacterium]